MEKIMLNFVPEKTFFKKSLMISIYHDFIRGGAKNVDKIKYIMVH